MPKQTDKNQKESMNRSKKVIEIKQPETISVVLVII